MKLSYMGGDVITKTLNEGKLFPAVFSEFHLIVSAEKTNELLHTIKHSDMTDGPLKSKIRPNSIQ